MRPPMGRPGPKPRGPISRRTWRPELAYALGILATDGNVSPDGRHITLVSRDIELLRTVSDILEVKSKLVLHRGGYTKSVAFHIVFGDRLFCEWLNEIGITPRKTYTIGALAIPDRMFADFLRGHLDGDGNIRSYVDSYNAKLKPYYVYQRLYVRFVSASRVHVDWLQVSVKRLFGLNGFLTVRPPSEGKVPIYGLFFAKKEAILLLRRLYYAPDVPCLARKRAIAEPFLTGELRQFRHPPGFRVRERSFAGPLRNATGPPPWGK